MNLKHGFLIFISIGILWGFWVGLVKNPECSPELGYDYHIAAGVANALLWPVAVPVAIIIGGKCRPE